MRTKATQFEITQVTFIGTTHEQDDDDRGADPVADIRALRSIDFVMRRRVDLRDDMMADNLAAKYMTGARNQVFGSNLR